MFLYCFLIIVKFNHFICYGHYNGSLIFTKLLTIFCDIIRPFKIEAQKHPFLGSYLGHSDLQVPKYGLNMSPKNTQKTPIYSPYIAPCRGKHINGHILALYGSTIEGRYRGRLWLVAIGGSLSQSSVELDLTDVVSSRASKRSCHQTTTV